MSIRDGERKQNVTLVLLPEVLSAAKHLAVDERTTLSGLVARLVTEEAARRHGWQGAVERIRDRLSRGYDLGTGGRSPVSRDALHER